MTEKRPIVLLNSSAGTAASLDSDELDLKIKDLFGRANCYVDVSVIENEIAFSRILDESLTDKRPIIVAGGDGSVAAAIQKMAQGNIPLGVLPMGTMNLLARDLGISANLEEAISQLVNAKIKRIDLGRINGEWFHSLFGLGFFANVAVERAYIREISPSTKNMNVALAALRSLIVSKDLILKLDIDNNEFDIETSALIVTNNCFKSNAWRRMRLDQGILEINMTRADLPFGLLRGGLAALLGAWREGEDVKTLSAHRIKISSNGHDEILASIDGEAKVISMPIQVELVPKALPVLMLP